MTAGEQVAAAALATVGSRFRAQGRDPALGLDCVGVVAVALGERGLPRDYPLRSATWRVEQVPGGMVACDGDAIGDVLLCRVTVAQLHLVVRTAGGFVHADAGLRRVVERPGKVPWPVVAAWRKEG
ncbi:MAG: peptidoglycan endopeptidase [Sphingomonas adhaesiva]|uniref:peptidoglycan endopeptidase n=1 Tax=Sphingomonas adhaesiva TaxID=28212 RepID=UPI002FF5D2E4